MIFRFIGGVGVGISTVAAPMFISEIAPPAMRGRLTGMFQFNIVFGILVAYLSNSLLGGIGENAWRWMLGVEAIPALLFTIFCFGLPESPRWLIVQNKNRAAGLAVLKRVNPGFSAEELDSLVKEIENSGNQKSKNQKFFTRKLLRPAFLAQALQTPKTGYSQK